MARLFDVADAARGPTCDRRSWWERYCAGAPRGLVAEGHFEASDGDRLTWDALIRMNRPSAPDAPASFQGEFTFTGGSGRYVDASGRANVAALQLGDANMDQLGSTAAALCGWIE